MRSSAAPGRGLLRDDSIARNDAPGQRIQLGQEVLVHLREVEARLALLALCERRRNRRGDLRRRVNRHQVVADVALAEPSACDVAPRLALEDRDLDRNATRTVLRDREVAAVPEDDLAEPAMNDLEVGHARASAGGAPADASLFTAPA